VAEKAKIERTLILIKPDAIERNLVGEILRRFEHKGLRIITAQMVQADIALAEDHYAEHKGSGPFFTKMVKAITCAPVIAMILEGKWAIQAARQLIGFASPLKQSPIGTIRADFAIEEPLNLVHGSDSPSAAEREITLWFGKEYIKPTSTAQSVGSWGPPKLNQKKITPKKLALKKEPPTQAIYDDFKKQMADTFMVPDGSLNANNAGKIEFAFKPDKTYNYLEEIAKVGDVN